MPVDCFKCYLKNAHDTQQIVGKHFIPCFLGVALTSKQLTYPKERVRKRKLHIKFDSSATSFLNGGNDSLWNSFGQFNTAIFWGRGEGG